MPGPSKRKCPGISSSRVTEDRHRIALEGFLPRLLVLPPLQGRHVGRFGVLHPFPAEVESRRGLVLTSHPRLFGGGGVLFPSIRGAPLESADAVDFRGRWFV